MGKQITAGEARALRAAGARAAADRAGRMDRGFAAPRPAGLYDRRNDHDACGVGFIADLKGRKSHDIIASGLRILENLTHRGAVGADPLVGDGAGMLIQIPHDFLAAEAARIGFELPQSGDYGVGFMFMPRDPALRGRQRASAAGRLGGPDLFDGRGLSRAGRMVERLYRLALVGQDLTGGLANRDGDRVVLTLGSAVDLILDRGEDVEAELLTTPQIADRVRAGRRVRTRGIVSGTPNYCYRFEHHPVTVSRLRRRCITAGLHVD